MEELTIEEVEMIEKRRKNVCYYNEGVDCYSRRCERCGWCPVVNERRRQEIREQIRQDAQYKIKIGVNGK